MSDQILSDLLERSVERVVTSEPPLGELLVRGHAVRRRRRRAAVAGAAVASLLVVGSVTAGVLVTQRSAAPGAHQPAGLPAPPAGTKWVGVGRTVVTVPRDWPVVPGVYCQGPNWPYVTIVQPVPVSCSPAGRARGGPPLNRSNIDIWGKPSGGLVAQLGGPERISHLTQRSLDASRTTLPTDWLAVPSSEPYGAAGTPTVRSEVNALRAAGFRVVRRNAAPDGRWLPVTTDPGIGTPARVGSTVVVYDHAAVASSATLRGQLRWVGGPAPGNPTLHSGAVHIVNADDSVDQTVRAGADGRWHIYLPPGTYHVWGKSPGFGSKAGTFDACSAGRAVTVSAHDPITVNVLCELK